MRWLVIPKVKLPASMQDAAKGTFHCHTIAIGMSDCTTPHVPTMMHIDSDTCDGISPMPSSTLQQKFLGSPSYPGSRV